jgi:hypothetical protein
MSFDQASGLYITWPTAFEGIVGRGEAKPGEEDHHAEQKYHISYNSKLVAIYFR